MRQLIRRFTPVASPTLSISDVHTKIKDFISKGQHEKALKLYKEEVHPYSLFDARTLFILPSIIKACAHARTHHFLNRQLHCFAIKTGSDLEPTVSNSVISVYAKFSDTGSARKLFDTMPHRDTISWNSIVNCYIQNGYCVEALQMFKEMHERGFVPKPELIASVLSTCVRTGDFRLGRQIHALVVADERTEESVFVSTALVDLYWRWGDSLMAFRVFNRMEVKNEVSWTTMIAGCATDHINDKALDCFRAMQFEGIKPNRVTLITVLPACTELGSIQHGKAIHGYAFRHGFNSDFRLSSALIHMYCKCGGALSPAKVIFERSPEKDVVMWASIIAGHSQSRDNAEEAISLFCEMRMEGIAPNSVTMLALISACINLSSIDYGCGVHCCIVKFGLNSDLFIGNALISMYAKCGGLRDSHQVFKELPATDSVSWSALISAYGLHGCGNKALKLYNEMQERGIEPDSITFLATLSACNHAGLVEEAQQLFAKAVKNDNISLSMEHYACHIDLLARAGKIENAFDVVSTMPVKPSMRIWSSLVSSCKLYGRLEVAEVLAHGLIKSEPDNAAHYSLLSMVYAESGNWLGVEEVRRCMKVEKLHKCYGFSRVELKNGD